MFGLLMFLNPIPCVSLTTQQMDFYYRLYIRPPEPAKKQRSTVLYNHNISNTSVTKNVPLSAQSQYPHPTLHNNVPLSCTITISPTQRLQKTFLFPVQSQFPHPTLHNNVLQPCIITISLSNPSQKRSTLLYNHNISNLPGTERVSLSCTITICPPTRHKKVLLSCTITISPTHPLQKTFYCPVQSQYLNPSFTENVLLSCTITISQTHPLQKTFYCPVQSQYLQPTRYRKRSTVLYNHNISHPPVTEKVLLSCTFTLSPTHSLQKSSTVLYNHNISNPPITEKFYSPVQSQYLHPPGHKTTLCRPLQSQCAIS